MKNTAKYTIALLLLASSSALGATIHVPADQPTIQTAINAAVNGDTIVVAVGTYFENIDFLGKAITVTSASGKSVTFIDGKHSGPVVTLKSGEGRNSVLQNFTLQNGSTLNFGGGIYVSFSSPTIRNNVVKNNAAGSGGAGIMLQFSSALVQGNTIMNNSSAPGITGGDGAGIDVEGAGSAQIIGNMILNNTLSSGNGGGISLSGAGTPTIENNVISGNVATGLSPASQGGAIYIDNSSDALVLQNLIYANNAGQGSGVYALVPYGNRGPLFVNNTIVGDPSSPQGSAVYISGFDDQVQFFNNVLIGPTGLNAVYCDSLYDKTPPTFRNNNAFSASGTGLQGTCSGESALNGNISANPSFVNASKNNYRPLAGSPLIDTGDNSAPTLPATDLAGNPRIVNGNGGPTAIIDLGTYEFVPVTVSTKSLSFGLHNVGSSTNKTVKLTNAQNKVLNISSYSAPTGYAVTGCGSTLAAFSSCSLTVTFQPLASGTFNGTLTITDDAGNSPQTVGLSGSAH